MDEHLTFKPHINILNAKLKRANNLLAIRRHYLSPNLLIMHNFTPTSHMAAKFGVTKQITLLKPQYFKTKLLE